MDDPLEVDRCTKVCLHFKTGFGDLKVSACAPKGSQDPPVEKDWFI